MPKSATKSRCTGVRKELVHLAHTSRGLGNLSSLFGLLWDSLLEALGKKFVKN